jgi:hypothetical protein
MRPRWGDSKDGGDNGLTRIPLSTCLAASTAASPERFLRWRYAESRTRETNAGPRLGDTAKQPNQTVPSWPGLSRPSTWSNLRNVKGLLAL